MSDFNSTAATDNLARFFETLTPVSLTRIDAFYAAQARFTDPFNEVCGVASIRRIFEHMFAVVEAPRFVVTARISEGRQAMLGWDFHLRLRGRDLVIHGVSHVCFDAGGLVIEHRDFWDPAGQIYARVPVVGGLMRLLQHRFSASVD